MDCCQSKTGKTRQQEEDFSAALAGLISMQESRSAHSGACAVASLSLGSQMCSSWCCCSKRSWPHHYSRNTSEHINGIQSSHEYLLRPG